jgi:hypothetical protein
MPLNEIVNVQITRQTQTVSQQGFGTLMILGTFKNFNDRIRYYSSMQDIAEDFTSTDSVYQAAQAVFAQPITPTRIAVGRRQADTVIVDVITAMAGKVYTNTINGDVFDITAANSNLESVVTMSANFVASNSIAITLNGVVLTPIVFSVDQATTMGLIQTALELQPNITNVSIGPDGANPNRVITVTSQPGYPGVVDSLVVTLGASQATAAIVNTAQDVSPESIALQMVDEINATAVDVTATDNEDGTYSVESVDPDIPFTFAVSTNIVNANAGLVEVLDASPNTLYQITLNGTLFQYTSTVQVQTNEEIAAELVALINADVALGITASDNLDGTFYLSSTGATFVAQVSLEVLAYSFGMIIEPLVATELVADSLDAVEGADDDWYAIACTDRTSAVVQAIALWAESRVKLFGTASADPNIIDQAVGTDTTSIAALFNNAGYVRSFVLYHQDAANDYPECAWFGRCLPFQPGSETWAFKTLTTMAYSDLTTNQSNNARNKKANTYEYVAGVGITQNGTVSGNEYIDIIRGVDWLTSTIQTYVFSVLVNSPKVPYTDAGITTIEAQIRRALQEGVENSFLTNDPDFVVTVPKAANVSSADKAARILRNVSFQATLAGAIQAVQINGTVTV